MVFHMRLAKPVIKKPMWDDIRAIYQPCREKYLAELGQVKAPEQRIFPYMAQRLLYNFELTADFNALFSYRVWLCHSKLPLVCKPDKSLRQ